MTRLLVLATFAYCMMLYPSVVRFTEATGYDAPIYWRAARGDASLPALDRGGIRAGWCYSDRLLPALSVFKSWEYRPFLLLVHTLNSLGVAALMAACLRRTHDYPVLAGAAAFVVGAKASDVVAGGNVTGLLCGMSLTPWGALAAAAVKPYFIVALVLHAALWGSYRMGRGQAQASRPRPLRRGGAVRVYPAQEAKGRNCPRCGVVMESNHHSCEWSAMERRLEGFEHP